MVLHGSITRERLSARRAGEHDHTDWLKQEVSVLRQDTLGEGRRTVRDAWIRELRLLRATIPWTEGQVRFCFLLYFTLLLLLYFLKFLIYV